MGVILTTAIIFAIVSVILEFSIVMKLVKVRDFVVRRPVMGIVLSLALSAVLGTVFGAAGLIVLIAGAMSTVLTGAVYSIMGAIQNKASKIGQWINDFKSTYRPVGIALKWTFLIILSPVWIPVWLHRKFTTPKEASA